MKNLLNNELQDNKREMEKKPNHVQNTSQEKNQTPNGTYIDFGAIMEENKNAELAEKKRRNSFPRTSLYMVLKNLLVTTRMMLLNLTISI